MLQIFVGRQAYIYQEFLASFNKQWQLAMVIMQMGDKRVLCHFLNYYMCMYCTWVPSFRAYKDLQKWEKMKTDVSFLQFALHGMHKRSKFCGSSFWQYIYSSYNNPSLNRDTL